MIQSMDQLQKPVNNNNISRKGSSFKKKTAI